MTPLTALLLLALGAEPPVERHVETHFPGATTVYQCAFESQDEEIYGWPSGWTRRLGPGFPRYIHMRLNNEQPPSGGRCLRTELNGGAAIAYSPSISVVPNVRYVLEGYVQTAGLRNNAAYLSLIFLDSTRTRLSRR